MSLTLRRELTWLSKLRFATLRFTVRARTELVLPPFLGSTLRGVFGRALKRVVCLADGTECQACPLRSSCPYVRLFEPPNTLPWLETSNLAPPFVLRPPVLRRRKIESGAELAFECVLIGPATEHLPYFLSAWQVAGEELGIGKGRMRGLGRFQIEKVTDALNPEILILADGMLLRAPELRSVASCIDGNERDVVLRTVFRTPARLRSEGHYLGRPGSEGVTPKKLLEAAYRRLYILAASYGDGKLGPLKIPAFPDAPPLFSSLRWQEWDRYSHRQRTRMHLGGVVGEMVLGPEFRPWFPVLRAAELLHVGKATSFGLGRIQCKGLAPPSPRRGATSKTDKAGNRHDR